MNSKHNDEIERKPVIGECRACRQKKEIVHSIAGLRYCADHVHLAPTRKQLDEYYNPGRKMFPMEWKENGR